MSLRAAHDRTEGTAALLRRRAIRGLIAYLALHRAPASFEELSEALWPGEDPARTRQRLFKAKQYAQLALGGALERCGAGYRLDLAKVKLDVLEIERICGRARRARRRSSAPSHSSGAPRSPMSTTPSPRASDGACSRFASICSHASRPPACVEAGDARASLDAAEELIALDQLNELGWRLAMEAEASLGIRRAIIDRYEALESELQNALGRRPQAVTRAVYRRLLGQA